MTFNNDYLFVILTFGVKLLRKRDAANCNLFNTNGMIFILSYFSNYIIKYIAELYDMAYDAHSYIRPEFFNLKTLKHKTL